MERAWGTLRLATRYADQGVVGFGMAGSETYALAPFVDVFNAATDAGIRMVHHAGEMAGPPSIREALDVGRAQRIGHGITIMEDPELVAEVRDRAVGLEVCPSSNVGLGLVTAFADHPLPRLHDAGLTVTLNTDIPAVVQRSLADEYRQVRDAFGYDDADLAAFARRGVDASFAPAPTKARIHQEIEDWLHHAEGLP